MEKQITKNWYMVLIKGIIMILLAILVLNHPGESLMGVAVYLGIGLKKSYTSAWNEFKGSLQLNKKN